MEKYSLFIGRWQCIPPHAGHIALIKKARFKPLIAIRDTKVSKKDPYTYEQRRKAFRKIFPEAKIIKIFNIGEVVYGRKVGYDIRKVKLSKDIENISGTKIRDNLGKRKKKIG